MKVQNPNLLMTVAAIDLTETEMEAIVGGLFQSQDYANFWNTYQNDTSPNKTVSIASIGTQIKTELANIKNNPTVFQSDFNNLTSWFTNLDSNTKSAIKNNNTFISGLSKLAVTDPTLGNPIINFFATH